MTAPDWRDDANCRDTDGEAFFPEGNGSTADRMVFEICERCPVRQQCLDYAIEHHERDGVWGGMSAASPTPPRISSADLRALADDIDREPGLGWMARLLCVAVLRGRADRQDREAER